MPGNTLFAPRPVSFSPQVTFAPTRKQEAPPRLYTPDEVPYKKFRPTATLLFGRRENGKSLIQTALLKARKQHMAKIGFPWQIWTNYWVRFADYKSPRLVDRLLEYPEEARNLTLGIDENPELHVEQAECGQGQPGLRDLPDADPETTHRDRVVNPVPVGHRHPDSPAIRPICAGRALEERGSRSSCSSTTTGGSTPVTTTVRSGPPRPGEFDWVTWVHGTDSIFGDYNTEEVIAPIWSSNREEILRTEGYTPKDVAEGLLGGEEGLGAEEADRRRKLVFRSILDGKAAFSITDTLPEARDILGLEWGKVGREQYVAWLEAHEYRIFEDGRRQLMGQRKDLEPGEGGVAPKTPDKDEGPDAEDIWGGEQ